MRRAVIAFAAASAFFVASCSDDGEGSGYDTRPHVLNIPRGVTRVEVRAPDGRVLKQLDDSDGIRRILDFLQAHREGWRYSDSGFPTPPLELFFYSGDQRLGRFGVSCGWDFETDLASKDDGVLRGIEAPEKDRHILLELLGMSDFHFEGEGCP